MQNLSVSTEAIWATFSADVPSSGEVWQSRGKMREIGTNSFRYAFGDTNGNINVQKVTLRLVQIMSGILKHGVQVTLILKVILIQCITQDGVNFIHSQPSTL